MPRGSNDRAGGAFQTQFALGYTACNTRLANCGLNLTTPSGRKTKSEGWNTFLRTKAIKPSSSALRFHDIENIGGNVTSDEFARVRQKYSSDQHYDAKAWETATARRSAPSWLLRAADDDILPLLPSAGRGPVARLVAEHANARPMEERFSRAIWQGCRAGVSFPWTP